MTTTTDYADARYFAISGIGYGKGYTAEEAETNYYEAQAANFPHLHKTKAGRIKWLKENAAPNVYLAPEGTTGFVLDHEGLHWEGPDGEFSSDATVDQVVKEA